MASIYDMVEAFQQLGLAMRAAGDEAAQTAEKVKEAAKETQAGIQNASSGGSLSTESSSLGDPRNATDQAARMIAAIKNATGR